MKADPLIDAKALGNELEFPENSLCISKTYILEDKGNLNNPRI